MVVAERYTALGSTGVMARNKRDDMAERIGRILREAREERGLTQADVAAALNVQRATVAGWETGRRLPDYPTLQSLMRVLGIPPQLLAAADLKRVPQEPSPEDRLRRAGAQLRAAVAEKFISRDVSKDVANPPRPALDEPRDLSPADVQAILNAANTNRRRRWYVAFRLALDAALARGEILGLQWKHIDLRAGAVTIEQQALRHGKYVVVSELKTKARRRTNPLAPETAELLRNWRDELRRRTGLDILPADAFVFPMQHRGRVYLNRPTSPEALDAAFRACCQDAGVQNATFHCLRATAATWMAEAGVPPKTAMRRLGHASLQTTLRFYTRVTDQSQQDAARILAKRLQEQP